MIFNKIIAGFPSCADLLRPDRYSRWFGNSDFQSQNDKNYQEVLINVWLEFSRSVAHIIAKQSQISAGELGVEIKKELSVMREGLNCAVWDPIDCLTNQTFYQPHLFACVAIAGDSAVDLDALDRQECIRVAVAAGAAQLLYRVTNLTSSNPNDSGQHLSEVIRHLPVDYGLVATLQTIASESTSSEGTSQLNDLVDEMVTVLELLNETLVNTMSSQQGNPGFIDQLIQTIAGVDNLKSILEPLLIPMYNNSFADGEQGENNHNLQALVRNLSFTKALLDLPDQVPTDTKLESGLAARLDTIFKTHGLDVSGAYTMFGGVFVQIIESYSQSGAKFSLDDFPNIRLALEPLCGKTADIPWMGDLYTLFVPMPKQQKVVSEPTVPNLPNGLPITADRPQNAVTIQQPESLPTKFIEFNPAIVQSHPETAIQLLDQGAKDLRNRLIGANGDPDQLREIKAELLRFQEVEASVQGAALNSGSTFLQLENKWFKVPPGTYEGMPGATPHAKWVAATLNWIDEVLAQSAIQPSAPPAEMARVNDDEADTDTEDHQDDDSPPQEPLVAGNFLSIATADQLKCPGTSYKYFKVPPPLGSGPIRQTWPYPQRMDDDI